jgi:catechol 2,3-dioxygenase-like lactoylglutathione lyase family enzyme
MSRIVHIAVKVAELEKPKAFYENVFGFKHVETVHHKGHISCHMSDGITDLTLIQYESEDAPEAMLAGAGPCIHHFAIEVDDPMKYEAEVRKFGCEVFTAPGKFPIKFRAPGGTVTEIVPEARYEKLGKARSK